MAQCGDFTSGRKSHCLAAVGGLRELLHGACAVSRARVQQLLGIERAAAELLLTRLVLHYRDEL